MIQERGPTPEIAAQARRDKLEPMEMNFCRRCGSKLTALDDTAFKCEQGHHQFANSAPAVGVLLVDGQQRLLLGIRAVDPGKGMLDVPGGFCNRNESLEEAVGRELMEELDVSPSDYSAPVYLLSHAEPYRCHSRVLRGLSGISVRGRCVRPV
jgi:NADH pyrophosphatase NudC (nudix superfamily)